MKTTVAKLASLVTILCVGGSKFLHESPQSRQMVSALVSIESLVELSVAELGKNQNRREGACLLTDVPVDCAAI
jgi:hypothetical protein